MTNTAQLYAVVDVETTGGKMSETRMTELAICITDGKEIQEQYSTLVNPERPIDKFVVRLTGISDKMVATAPKFGAISEKIRDLLHDKILVAHNAAFDYSILKKEFFQINQPLSLKTLCTVKASRKIIPGLSSYNLGAICKYLEINLENAHRALDDTVATTHLFHELVDRSNGNFLDIELKEQNYELTPPEHWVLESEILKKNGVIYLMDEDKNFVYISSEKNVKKCIYELLNPKSKDEAFAEKVRKNAKYLSVKYEKLKIKTELIALNEIQIFKPKYTKPFKAIKAQYAMLLNKDEKGLFYIDIEKITENLVSEFSPVINVSTLRSGEKAKKRLQNTLAFSKLRLLKNRLMKQKPLEPSSIENFNATFKEKFTENYSIHFKEGYLIYEFIDESIGQGIKIKDYYLDSWGTISLQGKNVEFSSEFEFVQKQKLTRSFKAISSKIGFKEIVINR